MNIPVDQEYLETRTVDQKLEYKTGHQCARHSAAEIANEADQQIEDLTFRNKQLLEMVNELERERKRLSDKARR